jgi:hypothetical protein
MHGGRPIRVYLFSAPSGDDSLCSVSLVARKCTQRKPPRCTKLEMGTHIRLYSNPYACFTVSRKQWPAVILSSWSLGLFVTFQPGTKAEGYYCSRGFVVQPWLPTFYVDHFSAFRDFVLLPMTHIEGIRASRCIEMPLLTFYAPFAPYSDNNCTTLRRPLRNAN